MLCYGWDLPIHNRYKTSFQHLNTQNTAPHNHYIGKFLLTFNKCLMYNLNTSTAVTTQDSLWNSIQASNQCCWALKSDQTKQDDPPMKKKKRSKFGYLFVTDRDPICNSCCNFLQLIGLINHCLIQNQNYFNHLSQ